MNYTLSARSGPRRRCMPAEAWLAAPALAALGMALCAGCSPPTASEPVGLRCAASLPPVAFLLERIGGERVHVTTLVAPGQSPHTFEPTPAQIAGLSDARLYAAVGLPFESALLAKAQASQPELIVVDTREGITLLPGDDHEHGHDHAHGDGDRGADPHFWVDPLRMKTMAGTIAAAMKRAAPAEAALFDRNLEALLCDLDAAHEHLKRTLAPVAGRTLFVYHPAFGYLAEAYGLKQCAVESEGKEPSARELAELVDRARRAGVRVIFQEPQYPAQGVQALAGEIGAQVQTLDPYGGDCIANFGRLGERIAAALAQQRE